MRLRTSAIAKFPASLQIKLRLRIQVHSVQVGCSNATPVAKCCDSNSTLRYPHSRVVEFPEAASRYPVLHRAVPIAKRSIPIHANVLGSAQLFMPEGPPWSRTPAAGMGQLEEQLVGSKTYDWRVLVASVIQVNPPANLTPSKSPARCHSIFFHLLTSSTRNVN